MDDEYEGAAAEILADYDTGKVVTRFLHPENGELILELDLDPEVAREYAFSLTKASYAIEAHNAA